MPMPREPHLVRNPFLGAYKKGWRAALAGKAKHENPYSTKHQTGRGGATWGISFWRAWVLGWEEAQTERREK